MKQLILLMSACVATVASAVVPGTYTSRDYEQNGLVAQWDGREYCAYDLHPASGYFWVDLIGQRNVRFNNLSTYSENGTYCDGNSTRWVKSYCGDFSCFDPSADGITVEIAVTLYNVNGTSPIITAPTGSGIAICQNAGNVQLASAEKGKQPVFEHGIANGHMLRLSVGYRNGEVVDEKLFLDGVPVTRSETTQTGQTCDDNVYMFRGSTGSYGNFTFHALRVYNRLLTQDEAAKNARIDKMRFHDRPSFVVVSGSVTADGVTYAAGDKVYGLRDGATVITAASDAVIRPAADGQAWLSIVGCSVALEPVASDEMVYVKTLALGANAVLTLPATGLGLNAATLTADATASVEGSGLLVSASETSPVTHGADVTYRAAGGTFEGWPSSGVAYVPVGSAPTISTEDDVAKVESLDAIVFLDDGTDAADTTTVSCSAVGGLTLSAKLNGPGVFASSSGGGVTVTGNNAKFLGNFDFSGVNVTVSDEHGLGSSVTRMAKIARSDTSTLVFDNGQNVFTNYAKVWINNTTKTAKRAIGSISAEKKLVLAETLEFGTSLGGSDSVYLENAMDLLKGYRLRDTDHSHHYLAASSASAAGECHIYGEIYQAKAAYAWFERPNTYFHQASYNIGRVIPATDKLTCGADDVFVNSHVTPNSDGRTLDLNGYDQHVYALNVYNNTSAGESGSATHIIDSTTPAKLIVVGGAYTSRPKFTGKAGFEYACASVGTNVFAGVASTSVGELKVSAGNMALRNGYSWVGKKVTVAGGRLILQSNQALSGGNAVVTLSGDGVLAICDGAGCVVNKLVCGDTTVETPGDYTIATLQGLGLPIEGPADFVVKVMRSYDVEWTGWPTTPGATAVVPKNTAVEVTAADVEHVKALAAIDMGPGASVTCGSDLANGFSLPKIMGFGEFVIRDTDGFVLDKDNSGLLSPGGFLISNSCVIVSNRYGLGSASTAAARIYCGTKSDALTFGGAGLTNNVPLRVWTGTGSDGGFVLGSKVPGEVFVQNAGLNLEASSSFKFRNVVRFSNGTITYYAAALSTPVHFYASFVKDALAKEVWFDAGSYVYAGGRRCYPSGGTWHLGGAWYSGQLHPSDKARWVCEKADVLSGLTFSPYAGVTFDLNGYDQGGLTWAPEYDGSREGSVVTSAVPAKVTITSTSYDTKYDTYAVSYRGEAGLTYAPTGSRGSPDYVTTWVNRFSDTAGPLDVTKGKLVFSSGAGWGGTNVTIRSGATLKVEATSAACAFKQAGKRGRTNLVIEEGGALNLVGSDDVVCRSLVYNGNVIEPGRYTSASSVGVTGSGTLVVRKTPGEHGLSVIIR